MPNLSLAALRVKLYDRVEQNYLLYPNSDTDRALNEALKVTNLFSGWSQGRTPAGFSVVNRVIYSKPSGMLFPMKLYMDNREIPKESITTLANTEQKWIKGIGVRTRYWAPIGLNLFALYPSDKLGGRYLEMWGITEPAKLVNESDTATIADELVDLVVEHAFMNMVVKEGGRVQSDAARLYKPWIQKVNALRFWEAKINPSGKTEMQQVA